MLIISSREFRDNQAQYFNRIDNGEQVIIQRGKNKAYSINMISESDLYFTPEMLARIDKALAQAERGEGVACKNYEESLKFFESL
jgi:PHD/YefM family antitoxin component YafN of YafNO toxin-antitoxin module